MLIDTKTIRYSQYDFKKVRASVGRNAIHDYPAMLHSNVVDSLIKEFCPQDGIIYDPFCGSGTTIIQSLLNGHKVYGTDINPLALLIAKVRSTNINIDFIKKLLIELEDQFPTLNYDIPHIKNISFWFKENVIKDLGKIRYFISIISNDDIRDFFLVSFSSIVRTVSNTRNNEFKRYRMPKEKLDDYNPDVLRIFKETINCYASIIKENGLLNKDYNLFLADTRKPLPFTENIDLVVTSPPYGDSQTTVAYGQFSSFALDWIRNLNPFGNADISLDRICLGGKIKKDEYLEISGILNDTLRLIYKKDLKRAHEVKSFFYDLFLSCKNIVNNLNNTAAICFVVGNRNVKGIQIPMDLIIVDFFESLGLHHFESRTREISNKRMPSLNSPTNIVGKKSPTMREEYVVILTKE